MRKTLFLILILIPPTLSFAGGNTTNDSISMSKKNLLYKVYHDHKTSFYCGWEFTSDEKLIPSDTYTIQRGNKRSKRIEWKHVVPAHAFGQSFKEWRIGDPDCVDKKEKPFKGRNCAGKKNMLFRYMESDMYNLVPAVGEFNGNLSTNSFAMIPGEKRQYGNCGMEIENKKAELPEHIRGDIARTYMYMDWAYPGRGIISKKNRRLFKAWSKADPVDDWERERCMRIMKVQGNNNPFVRSRLASNPLKKHLKIRPIGMYSGNTGLKVFHSKSCEHYMCKKCTAIFDNRAAAVKVGYHPCGICKP